VVAHSEDFVIVTCIVFIKHQDVTDGRTDRQTDAFTTAKNIGLAVARKKQWAL